MPRALLMVWSQPASPERAAEYDQWYDEVHIADLLEVPSVVGATRYRRSTHPMGKGAADLSDNMAIYEVECDDIDQFAKEFAEAQPTWRMSDAMQTKPFPTVVLFEESTPRQSK